MKTDALNKNKDDLCKLKLEESMAYARAKTIHSSLFHRITNK